jgi:hypothetical protein
MSVPSELAFPDAESLHDLGRYAARARAADPEGALRLQASGPVLAAWTCVLPGSGILRAGTVLGLRTLALAAPAEIDVTVPLGAVTDRTQRAGGGTTFPIPPTTVSVPWTALTPPRSDWERLAEVSTEELVTAATAGIAEIAQGTPDGAGRSAVSALRAAVWARPLPGQPDIRAGLAFAAYALGFLVPDGNATVLASGSWVRLSTPAGHALMR